MDLESDLQQSRGKPPWQMCGVKWALAIAQGEDREALQKSIDERLLSGDDVAKAIREHLGIPVIGEAIRRHRRGSCRCKA